MSGWRVETARQGFREENGGTLAPVSVKRAVARRYSESFENYVYTGCITPADYGLKGTLLTTF